MKETLLQRRFGKGRLKEHISPAERIISRSSYTYNQVNKDSGENARHGYESSHSHQ